MTDYVNEGAFELAGCPSIGGLGEPRTSNWTGGRAGWALKYNPLTRHVLGLGEPRTAGYTGGSGGGSSRNVRQTAQARWREGSYHQLLKQHPSRRWAEHPYAAVIPAHEGVNQRRQYATLANGDLSRGVLGLGTFYINGVGNCVPCGVSGLGDIDTERAARTYGGVRRLNNGSPYPDLRLVIRDSAVSGVPIAAGSAVAVLSDSGSAYYYVVVYQVGRDGRYSVRTGIRGRIPKRDVGPHTSGGYGRHVLGLGEFDLTDPMATYSSFSTPLKLAAIAAALTGAYLLLKHFKVIKGFKANRRRSRRRNAPFAVKGVFGAIGPARAAYGSIPAGGYKSLVDLNRRKGRSGRYSSRKIVAQHRLPAGSF